MSEDKVKVTEGEVEIEVEKPDLPVLQPMEPKPAFETSEKTNKIAGIVILVLAIIGVSIGVYLQVAHATSFWPFN